MARSIYKYTLDPAHAEEILAGLAGRPRLYNDEWLSIIGPRKMESYTVARGDNLWNISRRVFGNPFLWRKLWEVNPFLTNPHELTSGVLLKYYQEGADRDIASKPEPIRIPLIKLVPNAKGKLNDLDNDSYINPDLKNRFLTPYLVLTPEDPILGEVSGAYTEHAWIGELDPLYVKRYDKDLKPGETYAIAHEEKQLFDKTQTGSPFLGKLVRVVGELKIIEEGLSFYKAEVTTIMSRIKRGDLIIPKQKVAQWSVFVEPPNELQARIVMGEEPDYRYFAQGQIVVLNKGTADGMKEGYSFRVWREVDPNTEKDAGVEPISKGDIQIIYSGQLSSLGFIVRNTMPLEIGDTLVPRQAFTTPSKFIGRYRQYQEID
jgi:LysM domain